MNVILISITGIIFIFYGLICLITNHMRSEFERYGLIKFRQLTGFLELLGGIGLLVGMYNLPILIFSSAGFSILMLLGVVVRIKVKDKIFQILPAFFLMIINIYILVKCF
jgi:hypothetical protein